MIVGKGKAYWVALQCFVESSRGCHVRNNCEVELLCRRGREEGLHIVDLGLRADNRANGVLSRSSKELGEDVRGNKAVRASK